MTQVETRREGAVKVVTLNRPEVLNALDRSMFERLAQEVAPEPGVRAIVLTGSGRSFCSGADLTDPMMGFQLPPEQRPAACKAVLGGLMNALMQQIAECPVPVVAAVNGIAAGGGVGLALAADLTLAAVSAKFVVSFVPKLALVPDLGTTWHLAQRLGRQRALGLGLTGRPLDAATASDWGLIWEAVPDEALAERALALAAQLAEGPSRAQAAFRALVDAATDSLATQMDRERDAQALRVNDAETAEALRAFAARQKPDFSRT